MLAVKPFKSGNELNRDNQDLNSRRVIIKRVPHSFSEMDMLKIIQSRFGPIESIYQFKRLHRGKGKQASLGRYRSYSVVLNKPLVAHIMAAHGLLCLPDGQMAEICQYESYYEKALNQGDTIQIRVGPEAKYQLPAKTSNWSPKKAFHSNMPLTVTRCKTVSESESPHAGIANDLMYPMLPRHCQHSTKEIFMSSYKNRNELSDLATIQKSTQKIEHHVVDHLSKPTDRAYFLQYDTSQSNLINSTQDKQIAQEVFNLRINLRKPVGPA